MSNLHAANLQAQDAYRSVRKSPWTGRLARAGLLAKGVVYLLVGILAGLYAAGEGGETTNVKGAIERIGEQPFGQILLVFVAIGLLGYAFWRMVSAVSDVEGKGSSWKGILLRLGFFCSGLIHASLAFFTFQLLTGESPPSGDETRHWTATLMEQPFGVVLIALTALTVIGVGIYQFVIASKAKFQDDLRLSEMSATEKRWTVRAGKCGFAARGIVFCITGVFLLLAARDSNPGQARGLEGILDALARQTYGPILLGIVATGLAAYGIYMLIEARYRRVEH